MCNRQSIEWWYRKSCIIENNEFINNIFNTDIMAGKYITAENDIFKSYFRIYQQKHCLQFTVKQFLIGNIQKWCTKNTSSTDGWKLFKKKLENDQLIKEEKSEI